jgi:8-oxo-dGTP diphosphatase
MKRSAPPPTPRGRRSAETVWRTDIIERPAGGTDGWRPEPSPQEPRRETPLDARRLELHEETGLVNGADPPHIWHPGGVAPGYDGVVKEYFLVRTGAFRPRGALSDDELAAEHITGMRWWRHEDIATYGGTDLFSPRGVATPLAALITGHLPRTPVMLGL